MRAAPSVRILAGRWKGRLLAAPASARPTSSRARAALFSILGARVAGARVLDLYAGSGAVGIEAVSRGAATALLVEADPDPLRRSVELLGADARDVAVSPAREVGSAVRDLIRKGERFDVVFADPPYGSPAAPDELAEAGRLVADGGIFVLQRDSGLPEPALAGLALLDRRAYGRNVFFFFGMR